MLLQHILTKDIFLRVFGEDQFHRENNVAKELDALEETFFTSDVRREAIDRLRMYYGAIGRAADEIVDNAEKQQFLKALYEDFYKAYNPAAADRMGVVYTPNEVVDFIIRGTDHLLQKHFGRTLADDNVQILDPATGTGTFVANLINYLPMDRLEYKYQNEIHANELAILPYYIANLNIEYTYKERTGRYLEFLNLCFRRHLSTTWTGNSPARRALLLLGRAHSTWDQSQWTTGIGYKPRTRSPSASSWATRPTTTAPPCGATAAQTVHTQKSTAESRTPTSSPARPRRRTNTICTSASSGGPATGSRMTASSRSLPIAPTLTPGKTMGFGM